jgi:hypothetical protein
MDIELSFNFALQLSDLAAPGSRTGDGHPHCSQVLKKAQKKLAHRKGRNGGAARR